jgi:hypothetical protein
MAPDNLAEWVGCVLAGLLFLGSIAAIAVMIMSDRR